MGKGTTLTCTLCTLPGLKGGGLQRKTKWRQMPRGIHEALTAGNRNLCHLNSFQIFLIPGFFGGGVLENYHNLMTLLPLERAAVIVINLEVSCGWTLSFSWSCNLDLLPVPHFAENRVFWSKVIYHLFFVFIC